MEKTFGGQRLGAGKKMKVELHNYSRSSHDMGYVWRSTMAAGTLVPFMCEVALPGDTFDIKLSCDILTKPTVGPLFGSYKVQLDVFQAPIRLYHALLHNNELGIGLKMANVKLPIIEIPTIGGTTPVDFDNSQVNPSCLLSYLGIRGMGINQTAGAVYRNLNAVPILAYWEIYKQYYANKQEAIGAYIHTVNTAVIQTVTNIVAIVGGVTTTIPATAPGGNIPVDTGSKIRITFAGAVPLANQIYLQTSIGLYTFEQLSAGGTVATATTLEIDYRGTFYGPALLNSWRYKTPADLGNGRPIVQTFPLTAIDNMRKAILQKDGATAFTMTSQNYSPYKDLWEFNANGLNIQNNQQGLALKTYQSDMFNNWLQTDWIDGINGINKVTSISTVGNAFTLDTLNLAKKVYDMLNRIAVSGGTYDDWLDAVYTHDRYTRAESPIYHGGLIKEMVFQEIVSNAATPGEPLGSLAGRGKMSTKNKGGAIVIKVDEPSYIMGIVSLTPRLDYSQGNKWDINLKTLDDLHKPALDEIGFQELVTEQMAWWDTYWSVGLGRWVTRSAGKQPAWLNYMTNVNQTRGNFAIASNEMFMTLNRRYEVQPGTPPTIRDLTTYIDPSKFNFIFAQTSLDAQNFWAQIAVDITARRKMSAKVMPNL
ncbi:major capsid protein [Antarctic microvirus TYR_006_V_SP_13]|nr:major capsid protein [Antarctic microvirus TYR_006_V_SP_13]